MRYFRWLVQIGSPTPSWTTRVLFHSSPRQISSAASLVKKPRRRNRKDCQVQIDGSRFTGKPEHQAKFLRLGDGLSNEQQTVLDLVLSQGESVFFTGPAGTGKSFLLRKIIEGLKIKYLGDTHGCIAVTASTGLAAFSLGGTTLHSFAGIGLGKGPPEELIKNILKERLKLKRWTEVKVLIIDEISMIDSVLFDKIDTIARAVREIDLPFGGIQLVITGDFFQLPPVLQGVDDGSPRFCFEAKVWKTTIRHTIILTQIYRQIDPVFAGMLNEVREGLLTPTTIGAFRRLSRPLGSRADNQPDAAELYPRRREADVANIKRLQKIKSAAYKYLANDGDTDEDTRKMYLSNCMAPEALELKRGAQVMLIKNIDGSLVNGSQGRIIGFADRETFLHGQWHEKTHDKERGLHRCTTIALDGTPKYDLQLYPVVQFQLADSSMRIELCAPVVWTLERWVPDPWSDNGWAVEIVATRTQVPLILAWALSIHKAQGQTLELVKVDLDRVFEKGQAYVALSRAKSIDGLQVLNFSPNKVIAHPKVKAFYASLSRIPVTVAVK